MSPSTFQLNGTLKPALISVRNSGRIWPVIIISFLGMNVSIVALTVYLAASDKSVATEPDYYAKGINFNKTVQQREASARLGWTARPSLRRATRGRGMELAIAIEDRSGRPVTGATVSAIAFASVRSGERQSLALTPDPQAGVYVAPVDINRPGRWNIRITASRSGDTFTHETDLLVPDITP